MGRRGLVAGFALAIAVTAAAGCGGSGSARMSPSEYKAKIAAIGKEANQAQTGVDGAMHAKTTASLAATLTAFAHAEEKISKEIDGLSPPKEAQAANDELAKGTHDVSVAVENVIPQVKSAASAAAAIALLNKSSAGAKAGQEIDHAITQLRRLGYTTGS
jgi:hypothetical protein